jgi:hypothetical protein
VTLQSRRRRRRRSRLLVAALSVPFGVASPGEVPRASATESLHVVERTVGAPGPLGSVTFIGDSVGIGAGRFHPSLDDHLLAMGWGPIRFHAVDGKRTGYPPGWPDHFNAVPSIDQWQAAGWDSDTWIINLGANDSGYCGSDVACAEAAIMHVVDAIGPGHRIWWPKITRFYTLQHQADAWNAALDRVAARRDDVWTWDWPAEMRAHPDLYGSWDNTHLYPDGYLRRSAVMAQAFTAAVAVAGRVGPPESPPAPAGGPGALVPLTPVRLLDTRTDEPGRLVGGATVAIGVGERVPAGSTAVIVNVAAVDPAGPGYVRAHACDRPPPSSSFVNVVDRTRAASTIVPVSSSREICLTPSVTTDLVVDVQAAIGPASVTGGVRLTPLEQPERLLDTRRTGRSRVAVLEVPEGVEAAALNLTVTGADEPGYVAAHPCGGPVPQVSNVNIWPGDTAAAGAVIRAGADRTICVRSSASVDVIVDLTGVFRADGELVFVPAATKRMLDTRDGTGGWAPVHGAGQRLDVVVAPADARAVTATLTIVRPAAPSYLSAVPCDAPPGPARTSSVNAAAGDVVANSVTVAVSAGEVCVDALATGQTVLDVAGWWVPT